MDSRASEADWSNWVQTNPMEDALQGTHKAKKDSSERDGTKKKWRYGPEVPSERSEGETAAKLSEIPPVPNVQNWIFAHPLMADPTSLKNIASLENRVQPKALLVVERYRLDVCFNTRPFKHIGNDITTTRAIIFPLTLFWVATGHQHPAKQIQEWIPKTTLTSDVVQSITNLECYHMNCIINMFATILCKFTLMALLLSVLVRTELLLTIYMIRN